ncbi:hypothetical protein CIG19_08570 [Enterobacterales bacterium CwR94]|nr:hypothetical protein CIG19_08570 [Enterobacterales bacterium CwR94]
MRRFEELITYSEELTNHEGEHVKGLHLSLNPARALFVSHRVDAEYGTETKPFHLPRHSEDLRKVADAINKLADKLDNE